MKNSKNGIISKISTLKINSNKIYPKRNTQKFETPRRTTITKNPLINNTSIKIRVNILNNTEKINSFNNEKRLSKSKSKPKLVKKDSKKSVLTVNKSFYNQTTKNKNKKEETNFNTTVNTFFTTTQNENRYLKTETNDLKTNLITKNKSIKKRKSFGYINLENSNSNNFCLNKKNNATTIIENSKIKKTKSNTNIKINLNKNLNNTINTIKIKKVKSKPILNIKERESNIQKSKNRLSKSAKKLIIKKDKIKEEKSKINNERHSINEFTMKINLNQKSIQVLSPIKPNKRTSNIVNKINNNSEYKKKNSLNLFNTKGKDKNTIKKINLTNKRQNKNTNRKNNKNNNHKENLKNGNNKLINNFERKTSNTRPSKLINKNDNNKKPLDKNKSSKNLKSNNNNDSKINIIKNIDIQQSKENLDSKIKEKTENSDYINKSDKKEKENINSLNLFSKISSNRQNELKENDFSEIKKSPLKKKSLSQKDKIIINFDDLIEFDSKLDNIITSISSLSSLSNEEEKGISNDCSEFFSFYFNSSLNNIFANFFSKKNRIIINSGNNLLFFSIMILYHLSLNKEMLFDLLDDMKYIFSLLKINFFFLGKKIEFYYGDDFPLKCSDLFNQKFAQYISINCTNEIDLISKINKNCCDITERIKLILNYYERSKDRYYDEFSGIFKNLSNLSEKDINSYFFSYLYKNPFNSVKNKINEVNSINLNYAQKKSKSTKKYRNAKPKDNNLLNNGNESDNYLSDNFYSMSCKSEKSDNERELLSVKSYKSTNYFGKLKSDNIPNTTTINMKMMRMEQMLMK